MKKYMLFMFVFVLLTFNLNTTSAANCAPGDLFSSVTGQACGKIVSTPKTSSASQSDATVKIGSDVPIIWRTDNFEKRITLQSTIRSTGQQPRFTLNSTT